MKQFNLQEYLANPNQKVVTRDGRKVDIYYSPTSRIPLIGRTSDNEIHQYTKDGFQCDTFNQAKNDLFFADEEEKKYELTEFEKTMQEYYFPELDDFELKRFAKGILDLARKEIEKENFIISSDDSVFKRGFEIGKNEGIRLMERKRLKDLPKWKKCDDNLPYSHIGGLNERYLIKNGYCIKISDLETLQKEE